MTWFGLRIEPTTFKTCYARASGLVRGRKDCRLICVSFCFPLFRELYTLPTYHRFKLTLKYNYHILWKTRIIMFINRTTIKKLQINADRFLVPPFTPSLFRVYIYSFFFLFPFTMAQLRILNITVWLAGYSHNSNKILHKSLTRIICN